MIIDPVKAVPICTFEQYIEHRKNVFYPYKIVNSAILTCIMIIM